MAKGRRKVMSGRMNKEGKKKEKGYEKKIIEKM